MRSIPNISNQIKKLVETATILEKNIWRLYILKHFFSPQVKPNEIIITRK